MFTLPGPLFAPFSRGSKYHWGKRSLLLVLEFSFGVRAALAAVSLRLILQGVNGWGPKSSSSSCPGLLSFDPHPMISPRLLALNILSSLPPLLSHSASSCSLHHLKLTMFPTAHPHPQQPAYSAHTHSTNPHPHVSLVAHHPLTHRRQVVQLHRKCPRDGASDLNQCRSGCCVASREAGDRVHSTTICLPSTLILSHPLRMLHRRIRLEDIWRCPRLCRRHGGR